MAGAFIAFGGAASNVAVHDISNVGLARTLAGVIFPVGLMLVVLVGGELFTGNCLMIMARMDKKIKHDFYASKYDCSLHQQFSRCIDN